MTVDATPPAAGEPAAAPRPRSACGTLAAGCGGLVAVAVIAVVGLSVQASGSLDRRVDALGQRITAWRAALRTERPVLLGEPVDGNAADHYHAVEWVLGPRREWTQPPPNLPPTDLPRDHPATAKLQPSHAFKDLEVVLDAGAPPAAELDEVVATYGGLTRHVYDGLRRTRCDWDHQPERGVAASIPNLLALRTAANLLAVEAVRAADPTASARAGLAAVGLGRDVARQPTLISTMLGCSLEGIGLRAIARTTRQRALPRAAYEELLRALDRLEPLDLNAGLDGERTAIEVELARQCGRPLPGGSTEALAPGVPAWLGPLFYEREWSTYVALMDRLVAALRLPYAEARAAHDQVLADAEKSWTLLAAIGLPNLFGYRERLDETVALRGACRVLVAAHLHRLDTGAFPADLEALRPRLGGALPQDPFSGQPLRLARDGDALRCWSVGKDLKDDGGAAAKAPGQDAPDVVLATAAPPP